MRENVRVRGDAWILRHRSMANIETHTVSQTHTVSVRSTSDDWFSQVAQERQTQSPVTASVEGERQTQSPASVEGEPTNSHGLGHVPRERLP